jgi:transposase InsO family protein
VDLKFRESRSQGVEESGSARLLESRYVVKWDLRESMTGADILQRAKELHPEAKPRIISDNGPQFIAKDLQGVHSDLGHALRQKVAYRTLA